MASSTRCEYSRSLTLNPINQNVVVKFCHSLQTSGKGYSSISQLPIELLKRCDGPLGDLAPSLVVLEQATRIASVLPEALLNALKHLQALFVPPMLMDAFGARTDIDRVEKLAISFRQQGGLSLLSTLLISSDTFPDQSRIHSFVKQIQQFYLEILSRLSILDPDCSTMLSDCDPLLHQCFHFLFCPKLAPKACDLLEHLLLARKELLPLHSISDIEKLLTIMDDDALANTYRLLAVVVSDFDECDNKPSLMAQHRHKLQYPGADPNSVPSANRELVLSMPHFLQRLVDYACRLPYEPRYPSLSVETDHWLSWIDEHITQGLQGYSEGMEGLLEAVLETVMQEATPMNPQRRSNQVGGNGPPTGNTMTTWIGTDLSHRVDAIYLLSLLLTGKQRPLVQEQLAVLKLMPRISELFDQLIWKKQVHRHASGQFISCNCSPEVILKIQLLRLVHNFCYHSQYKHVLLSPNEWTELQRLQASTSSAPLQYAQLSTSHFCKGTSGLLSKIINVLIKEPVKSVFRFWLCRAVESWLRGSSNFADQVFVIHRGLLQHIVAVIIEEDRLDNDEESNASAQPSREVVQSSFDLLGEVLRFSVHGCSLLDAILNAKVKIQRFLTAVHANLVDSNMFLRSVFLSLDHFLHPISGGQNSSGYATHSWVNHALPTSKFFSLFLHSKRRVQYLACLVSAISIDTLTLENVSCLNTALILLMLAERQGTLARYLQALAQGEYMPTDLAVKEPGVDLDMSNVLAPHQVLSSLFKLLQFWRVHYQEGDHNCTSLEKSSGIPFRMWTHTVDTLISSDRTSRASLLHYLPDHCSNLHADFAMDLDI